MTARTRSTDPPPRSRLTPIPGTGNFPRLLGGRFCLDFANTLEDLASPAPIEFLRDWRDLVAWAVFAEMLSPAEADRIRRAGDAGADLTPLFDQALVVRAAITQVFTAIAEGEGPAARDLATLRQTFAHGLTAVALSPVGGRYDWRWTTPGRLDQIAWVAASSAIAVLRDDDPRRVRRCPGPTGECGWLFYDTSKNATRHWCSMEGCGSQAKMRRYRRRATSR